MNRFAKGAMGLLLTGLLGLGAMDAMAGGMGFCPPSKARHAMAPAYPRAIGPQFAPVAYRFAPPPSAMRTNRPMWAWNAPRTMVRNPFMGPMRWQGAPGRTAYPVADYGVAQMPYPVKAWAPYPASVVSQRIMPQQAYRQAPQIDPMHRRHWVAAR